MNDINNEFEVQIKSLSGFGMPIDSRLLPSKLIRPGMDDLEIKADKYKCVAGICCPD